MKRMYTNGMITQGLGLGCQEKTGVLRGKGFELFKPNASGVRGGTPV